MKRHIHTIMLLLLVACLTCGNVVHASADIFDTDLVEQYEVAPRYKKTPIIKCVNRNCGKIQEK